MTLQKVEWRSSELTFRSQSIWFQYRPLCRLS